MNWERTREIVIDSEAPDENDFGEPPCAAPVDIGWNPQPDEAPPEDGFESSAHDSISQRSSDEPVQGVAREEQTENGPSPTVSDDGDDRRAILVDQIRKENLSLAATLEKAKEWVWSEGRLSLSFGSEYEASVAKGEADTIRRTAAAAGMPPFTLVVETTESGEQPSESAESPRVELVRRVFRGQVMKK